MEARAEWLTPAPAPPLRSFIDRYVGYRLAGFAPGVHPGLASRHMTFIVSIGPGIEVLCQTDPRYPPARYQCAIAGLQASSALDLTHGHQEGVAIELSPLGCRALFGVPARALWSTSLAFAELAGYELWDRLQAEAPWAERFAACDRRHPGRPGAGRRGLRFPRVHRPQPRAQPVELQHLQGRLSAGHRDAFLTATYVEPAGRSGGRWLGGAPDRRGGKGWSE